ncbi:condensation domain-containing protein [Nocardia sp. CA-128927]|uniref:condensation domain-containing protein n=1 Tax=Nocardia sp. CA-128927 TaxID=3239975 RepID=UPI003D97FB22
MVTTRVEDISMITVGEWTPRGGELVEFVPVTQSREAARRAPVSPAPVSLLQQSHIRNKLAAERAGGAPASSLGGVCTMTGRLDRAAAQQAVTAFVLRHETLRCWFAVEEADGGFALTRHLVPSADVAFTTVSTGMFAASADIRVAAGRRFRTDTNPVRWPAFVFGAIDHGDEFTLFFSMDHSSTDGYSILLAFTELHALYRAYSTGTAADLPETGSHLDFCRAESRVLEQLDLEAPAIEEVLALLRDSADEFRQLPLDYGLAPGQTAARTDTRLAILDADEADAFAAVCRANDASFGVGLLAALAITDLEFAGRTSHHSFHVVSARTDPAYHAAQGWFVNYLPIGLTVGRDALFTHAAKEAAGAFNRLKPLIGVPILGLLGASGAPLASFASPPMVSYLDYRRFSIASMPDVHSIHSLTTDSVLGPVAQVWFSREAHHTVILVKHPDTAVARESAGGYVRQLRRVVHDVAHTGDFHAVAPARKP